MENSLQKTNESSEEGAIPVLETAEKMPIFLEYRAQIVPVLQIEHEGQPAFLFYARLPRESGNTTPQLLTPDDLLEQFFRISSPSQALAFFRSSGYFLQPAIQISEGEYSTDALLTWGDFQRWQAIAKLASVPHLARQMREAQAPTNTAALGAALVLFDAPHSYFGEPVEAASRRATLEPFSLPELKHFSFCQPRSDEEIAEQEAVAAKKRAELIEKYETLAQAHRELWFSTPSSLLATMTHCLQAADGLGFIPQESAGLFEDTRTFFRAWKYQATCTLQAIACAIDAQRVARIEIRACLGCGVPFRAHGVKKFCSATCKSRVNTHNSRVKANRRAGKAA